jgi:hypothetical protein
MTDPIVASLARGLEQSAAGETADLGDFSQYVEDRPVNGDSPEPDPVLIEELSQIADGEKAAAAQHAEDVAWQAEHPNEPLIRQANPAVGGEWF